MKHLELNDLERLAREIGAHTKDPGAWAESVGLSPQLLEELGNVAVMAARDDTMAAARQRFEDKGVDFDDPDFDPTDVAVPDVIAMNIGEIIKKACVSMFALGFETHKQFGNQSDSMGPFNDPSCS